MPDAIRRILVSSASVGFFRALSLALGFIQSVLLARVFGAEAFGQWMLVFGFAGILAMVARLGLDAALLVRAAHLIGEGRLRDAQHAAIASLWIALALAILPVVALLSVPESIGAVLGDRALSSLLVVFCAVILVHQASGQLVSWLRANDLATQASMLGDALPVFLHVLLLLVLWGRGGDFSIVSFAIWSVVIQAFVLFILHLTVQRLAPLPLKLPERRAWQELLKMAPDYYGIALAGAFGSWFVLWMVSVFAHGKEIAQFAIALRLVTSGVLVTGIVNFVIVPRMAERHASGDSDGLRVQFGTGLNINVAVALPLLLLIAVFSEQLLLIWGEQFADAAPLVWILAIGELVNILTGSCGYAMTVSGYQRMMLRVTLYSLASRLALCLILIPKFGLTGAAVAQAAAMTLEHMAKSYLASAKLGIHPFPLNLLLERNT